MKWVAAVVTCIVVLFLSLWIRASAQRDDLRQELSGRPTWTTVRQMTDQAELTAFRAGYRAAKKSSHRWTNAEILKLVQVLQDARP
jgi:hypothetical protein